ncbi:MAG TPA: molybdopterin molybdotransferase MoeA [Bacteriovoracaceae bacterium]|nr:molybdopterin molybdotransferase MoeA [Bacteriovoracaceae bacterium]
MITVQEANQIIRQYLNAGDDLTLAENLYSDRHYPPFNRVMMDGIAVSYEAYKAGRRAFTIEGISPAGEPAQKLINSNGCLEVMTGAPIPLGTDLVIQYEHLNLVNGIASVVVETPRALLENVHLEGSDCKKGDMVLAAGEIMNGPHVGIAASMGYSKIHRHISRIMIISTGNELVEVDQVPEDFQIRRSNAHALKASMLLNGYENIVLDHLDDDPKSVAAHYEKSAPQFDLMIYSGGVSKGKFDYLPNVWTDMGVKKHFHEVSQRPGKPLWFGVDENLKTAVVGLPGNPVSSLVCLHRYILNGRKMFARLTSDIIFKKDLTFFVPVKIDFLTDGTLTATPLKIKNSGEFTALAGSDGFIELPAHQSEFKSGESFAFFAWRNF